MKKMKFGLLCVCLLTLILLGSMALPVSAADASVSLSATGPSGTLGSAGGELSSSSYPASYTVYASASGCAVTKIMYSHNGQIYTESGSSVTITASNESEFTTTTFTAYTTAGVTATFTVNFKYMKLTTAKVMWETSDEATIYSITGNGMSKSLSYSMTIPNSYSSQGNLTSSQIAEIQGLIGVNDGKTYSVNYTRTIYVYTPPEHSSTGSRIDLGTFDGGSSGDIEYCLSRWGWSSGTKAAIRQAASSSLSFTTSIEASCTAVWIDSTTGSQIYSKDFGSPVSSSSSTTVSVSYSDYAWSDSYVFDYLSYSGDSNGTSYSQTFSQTITASSKPINVIFYCHSDTGDSGDEDGSSDNGTGSIEVFVRDASTSAILISSYVYGDGYGGYTGSSGSITFDNVPYGDYYFTASYSGYDDGGASVSLSSRNSSPSVTIYLSETAEEDEEQYGRIRVYVRNSITDELISGATVSGAGEVKTTTSNGYVTFYYLPASYSFGFTATMDEYTSASGYAYPGVWEDTELILYLTPDITSGTINVTVTNLKTGEAIPSALVGYGDYAGYTDSNGKLTFADVPFGDYTFTATKDGFYSNVGITTISESAPVGEMDIKLSPVQKTGTINISVKDAENGKLISGATVTTNGYSLTTDANGKVSFADMDFGTYEFWASHSKYHDSWNTATISKSATTKSIIIYMEHRYVDVGVEANIVKGQIFKGSQIIVTATVTGDAEHDITINKPLTLKVTATRNNGKVFDTNTSYVMLPKGETNLIWFVIDIPKDGFTSSDIKFTFSFTSFPYGLEDLNTRNNTDTIEATVYDLPSRSTPAPSLELDPPPGYYYSKINYPGSSTCSWSVWEWDVAKNKFVKNTYTAYLDVKSTLYPDSSAVWKKQDASGIWTTRSGYGLNTDVSVSIAGNHGNMFAGSAKINTYFPEYNYDYDTSRSNLLLPLTEDIYGYSATFGFPKDTSSVSGGRMHKTPVWFPDKDYCIVHEIYDIWTPDGVLMSYSCPYVKIEGSMYDDYYTNRN